MALITADKLTKIKKERNSVRKPTAASYTSFIENDKRYFQIGTYGSAERIMKDQASQFNQFNEETAKTLIDILKKEFNL